MSTERFHKHYYYTTVLNFVRYIVHFNTITLLTPAEHHFHISIHLGVFRVTRAALEPPPLMEVEVGGDRGHVLAKIR